MILCANPSGKLANFHEDLLMPHTKKKCCRIKNSINIKAVYFGYPKTPKGQNRINNSTKHKLVFLRKTLCDFGICSHIFTIIHTKFRLWNWKQIWHTFHNLQNMQTDFFLILSGFSRRDSRPENIFFWQVRDSEWDGMEIKKTKT